MTTRSEAIAAAGDRLARAREVRDSYFPRTGDYLATHFGQAADVDRDRAEAVLVALGWPPASGSAKQVAA